jgi:ubiquinone/menaquinone biosynthesis C-methylase UbiE
MRVFLRQSTVGREPLAVAMSGVRMGERLLQIGIDTPLVTSLLAAKPGLSGESAIVVVDEATAVRARKAVSETGALVNVAVHGLDGLPFDNGSFDLVVFHNRTGELASHVNGQDLRALGESRRVLRPGGRIVVVEKGAPSGLSTIFQSRTKQGQPETTIRGLEAAGFRAVRMLGDRDGYRFVEGLKSGHGVSG